MARVTVEEFIGPTNKLLANVVDPSRSINLYPERTPPGLARVPIWLTNSPGLDPWTILDASPVRALFQQDGRAFAVGGGKFYEVFNPPASTAYGSIATDDYMATICSNGSAGDQLMIVSGELGYTFTLSSNSLAQISDSDFPNPARMGEFMDGYGIVSKFNSRTFQISALEDFSDWDALDVFERSEGSDNIIALIRQNRNIWLIGSKTSEIWYDSGDALTPFQPIQGTFVDHGAAAPFSVQRINNTLMWLSQDELGQGEVVVANGYNPEQVTTYSIAGFLRQGSLASDGDLSLAKAWTYQENGHSFYCVLVPTATSTFCLDVSGITSGMWHERATWNGSEYLPHVVQCHMSAFGRHLVGDRSSGAIYNQSLDIFHEAVVG